MTHKHPGDNPRLETALACHWVPSLFSVCLSRKLWITHTHHHENTNKTHRGGPNTHPTSDACALESMANIHTPKSPETLDVSHQTQVLGKETWKESKFRILIMTASPLSPAMIICVWGHVSGSRRETNLEAMGIYGHMTLLPYISHGNRKRWSNNLQT